MLSDGVITSIIGVAGGVLVAYITARFRKTRPKSEYIDTAFDAYEKAMKRLEAENTRLRDDNDRKDDEIDRLKERSN